MIDGLIPWHLKTFSFHIASDRIIKNNLLLFIESKFTPTFVGKLGGERSVNSSNYRSVASFRRDDVHICSAILISNRHALTAATCLKEILNEIEIPSFDQFTLVAGGFDIDNGTKVFKIEQVQIHHRFSYHSPNPVHNIGVIRVNY